MDKIKVLVVDDTIVYRKIISDVLHDFPDVEVVGSANNGRIALSRIESLKPDLVTLDIEMPKMSGIEVLEHLENVPNAPIAIMLSTLTHKGSDMTIKALELGAFDFIPKPDGGRMADNIIKIKAAFTPIFESFKRQRNIRLRLKGKIPTDSTALKKSPYHAVSKRPITTARTRNTLSEIVGIGISTGGPNALSKMIPMLSKKINVPVLIVQHMPPMFTASLAKSLNSKSELNVKEAVNGDPIMPNTIFIAPGGKQMKIIAGADGKTRNIKITDDPPENSCKPSADYLFRSIAQHYVGRATGVIMTGMGSDGTKGLQMMKKNGSIIIAQDQATCTVYGMPKEPIESGITDIIAPLDKIAEEITKTVIR